MLARPDRKTAGLIVVAAMALFLGAASLAQQLSDVEDTADGAQAAAEQAAASAEEASSDAEAASDKADDLETRVGDLESRSSQASPYGY